MNIRPTGNADVEAQIASLRRVARYHGFESSIRNADAHVTRPPVGQQRTMKEDAGHDVPVDLQTITVQYETEIGEIRGRVGPVFCLASGQPTEETRFLAVVRNSIIAQARDVRGADRQSSKTIECTLPHRPVRRWGSAVEGRRAQRGADR